MATINLGAIKFNWKGAYNNGTAYTVDDVVSSGGSSYVCIAASTGNAVSNGTYWQQMSAAGTDGTDVGTTITTQGDILYRDGSGLQRLPKGTAAQELRMNSGATAPEWYTPTVATSDFVKLGSTTLSSAAGSVDFTSGFSDDYNVYKLFIDGMKPDGGSGYLGVRVGYGGSFYGGAAYHGSDAGFGEAWSGSWSIQNTGNLTSFVLGNRRHTGNNADATMNYEITMYNLRRTVGHKHFSAYGVCDGNSDSESSVMIVGGKINDGAVADNKIDRVRVLAHSNNFNLGTVTLYGIKK